MKSYDYGPWGADDPVYFLRGPADDPVYFLRGPFEWIPDDWELDIPGMKTITMVEWEEDE